MTSQRARGIWLTLTLVGVAFTILSVILSVAASFDEYAVRMFAQTYYASSGERSVSDPAREARLGVAAALKLNPLDAGYWFHRHQFVGDSACATPGRECEVSIESLREAIHRRPHWAWAWALLAAKLAERGDQPKDAVFALERALRFGPLEVPVPIAVLLVGLAYPEQLNDAMRQHLERVSLLLLETEPRLLVSNVEQLGFSDRAKGLFAAIGRGESFEDARKAYLNDMGVALGR